MATGHQQESATKRRGEAEAKWAAIVDDRLVPMPRRRSRPATFCTSPALSRA